VPGNQGWAGLRARGTQMSKIRSSFALLAGCAVALGFGGTGALAADMGLPTKSAPIAAAAPPPLDIHGFVEFDWVSSFMNPQGLLLNQHGAENVVAGLNWTVWHGGGWISNVTVGGLAFADFSHPQGVWDSWAPTQYGDLFDFGGQLSASATFFQYWTLRESYTVVINAHVGGFNSIDALTTCNVPGLHNGCGASSPLPFNQLRLTFGDSFTGWPITFNPYVEWWWSFNNFDQAATGGLSETAACFPCGPNRGDFLIGIDPTISLAKWWGVPLTLKAPTYITVGPADFWVGSSAGGGVIFPATSCGVPVKMPCTPVSNIPTAGDWGVFTTGLTAIYDLKFIPSNYGGWYIKGGFQYYNVINSILRTQNLGVSGDGSQNVWLGFAGIGVHF
jgi:hypothetical protein